MTNTKTATIKDTRRIDWLMTVAGAIHPLTALPQVITIYATHDVSGISIWTWLGFMSLGVIFLLYGIAHSLKPFILNQIIWFAIDFAIVIGIVLYR